MRLCRSRPGGKIRRLLGKVKNATSKIFPLKGLTRPQPCYCEGASLILNIKVQDAPSGAEQGADLESALQTMKRAAKPIKPLSEHVASTAHMHQRTSKLHVISRIFDKLLGCFWSRMRYADGAGGYTEKQC
ncbi:hypothetical protein BDR07DRAFT_1038520 [Suillus spraguei]|nr:hypothetical protein BDR07DRAFT_1038520 [Suillus spraguei]